MSPARIRRRKNKNSVTYQVVYRRGGRGFPVESAGTFSKKREAEIRRDLIGGWLAAGLDPRVELERLTAPLVASTHAQDWDRFIGSRVDVGEKALGGYRNAREWVVPLFGQRRSAELTNADVQEAIAAMSAKLSPATVEHYLSSWRLVFDFVDVDPNPARSRKVKLPAKRRREVQPPEGGEWARIKARLKLSLLLPMRLVEACGLRASEIRQLELGDVDFVEGRLRISKERTKGRTAGQRWLPVPDPLMDELADLWPIEERERERKAFTLKEASLRHELDRACRAAGTAHYSPHKLRHRRISLWFLHGIDEVTISRWAGHSQASMSSDMYGHVIVSGDDEWREFWVAAYGRQRAVRAAERRSSEVEA